MIDTHNLDPNAVVSREIIRRHEFAERRNLEDYWTEERMAAAQPFELRADPAPEMESDPSFEDLPQPWGLKPKRAEPDSANKRIEGFRDLAPRFDTGPVNGTDNFPYSAVGKLFARIHGVDRCGTAFVVGPRAIVTAGHCVFPDGARHWVDQVAFSPGFSGGAPHGLWAATSLHTLAGWAAQAANARLFDLGGAVLDRPISQVTGAIGWLANIPPHQGPFHSVGYPMQWVSPQFPFDGNRMWRCVGQQIPSTGLLKMANNMTEGSSGGPWLIARNGNIYVNGLNSFRSSSEPDTLVSPYFGAGFVNLMTRLSN